MRLRHILAVVDSSAAGSHAAWRAARLAWSHGAALSLLTMLELPDAHPSSRHGPSAPPVRARAALDDLADEIAAAVGIRPKVVVGLDGTSDEALRKHARGMGLVVVPADGADARLPRWLQGSRAGLAERFLRSAGTPVFIVRRPPGVAHRCALVVAGPDIDTVGPLLRAAQWFCRPEALLACHVLDPAIQRHLHAADLPMQAVHSWMETATRRAELALGEQLARAGLHAAQALVLQGNALVRVLRELRGRGASLLVVGQQRRSRWAELLRPGLGRRLAGHAGCDVLWLPSPTPSAQAACDRLGWPGAASH